MDFSFKNNLRPKKGALLLSDPFEMGAFFTRSVVLICDYNADGTFGFVLNNYLELTPSEISQELDGYEGRVSVGGPVDSSSLFYIHQLENIEGSEKVMDNLYFGGDFLEIINAIRTQPQNASKVRFFAGYSGWSGGQLEEELEQHSWIVVDNHSIQHIMDTSNDNLWKDIMKLQGSKYKVLSDFPLNPTHN